MSKASIAIGLVLSFLGSSSANASNLPRTMNCQVSGHAGCSNGICVGAGTRDPTIKLTISRTERTLQLNRISGTIDNAAGDPYADGPHRIVWRRGLIAYDTYRLHQPQPGRMFLTLSNSNEELEFQCLGSLYAKE